MDELNCNTVRDLLPSFDEELLHTSVRAAVTEHLTNCPACVAALNAHRSRMRTAQLIGRERDKKFCKSAAKTRAYWKNFIIAFILSLIGTLVAAFFILPLLCAVF
ncbi:MAG: zf-HC2 domain-containing protein [Oscillospiraceae bacterium]|nr:zf-HC2 domain-containing protein [Oscillospiraceae bacterium]